MKNAGLHDEHHDAHDEHHDILAHMMIKIMTMHIPRYHHGSSGSRNGKHTWDTFGKMRDIMTTQWHEDTSADETSRSPNDVHETHPS